MKSLFSVLWERHLAAMIVAGSHSHKNGTSLLSRMAPRAITCFLRVHQSRATPDHGLRRRFSTAC
jgi:hypothetical protein